jgi:hypothetical protein
MSYVKIEVFVPASHLDAVLDALHAAGAGHAGAYDRCASFHPVRGRWRPLDAADPYDGVIGEQSEADELKIEVRCEGELAADAVRAAREVHPYEEPVINVIALVDL